MEIEIQEQVAVNILWDNILFVALQGTLDSRRTQVMLERVLNKIHETGASVIILDILGVSVVDSAVANHLIKLGQATKLMGCETVISGISPEIAQTIVQLGVHLGDTTTTSTIRDALRVALKSTGQEITPLS
ncbi:STAS domain-containing protein [Marinobacterium jannaschii]|uniref:STAS domain-containing protein n=1 Tax=Marinobacterium jannaschii TaxID=64970 RepID=UPI0005665FF2|nr:STAS domain-containing protein [Marinobacterium jannaschii]